MPFAEAPHQSMSVRCGRGEQYASHPDKDVVNDNGPDEQDASVLEELLEGGVNSLLSYNSPPVSFSGR